MAYRRAAICLQPLSEVIFFTNRTTSLLGPKPSNPFKNPLNLWLPRVSMSLLSMKKDPSLEKALKINRRWTINNQLKTIIQHCPQQTASVDFLQKKFNKLDIRQGDAVNWVRKYPCFFETYTENFLTYVRFSKKMRLLIEEEEAVKEQQEEVLAENLEKILMLTRKKRLGVVKFGDLRKYFGFPDDYVLRVAGKEGVFRVLDCEGKRNSLEIELKIPNPRLAVSFVEKKGGEYENRLPEGFGIYSLEKFNKFQQIPYISPYEGFEGLEDDSEELEKWRVGVIHELLSLTLWKRASVAKLAKFQREFGFPENLVAFLMRHPAIFYVSNQNNMHTVVLREGYAEGELIEKDPLVVVKEKFGELMQEGLYEYTERRRRVNLEKNKIRKPSQPLWKMSNDFKQLGREIFKPSSDTPEKKEERYQKEARERFRKAL